MRYSLRPCECNGWSLITEGTPGEGERVRSPEEWAKELKDYDYVAIYFADNAFREEYKGLFEEEDEGYIEDGMVYRVDYLDGKLKKPAHSNTD